MASQGKSHDAEAASTAASEDGAPALFTWADVDGDGRLDLAAVGTDGTLQLLASADDGRFEDVTEQVGLAGIGNAAFALWADYDGDSRLDLFVGAREGKSRLFHNEGELFVDMSDGSGLQVEGAVQSAHWLDHDGDGWLDLHVVTPRKNELFHGLEGGFFERSELPLATVSDRPIPAGSSGSGGDDAPAHVGSPSTEEGVELDSAFTMAPVIGNGSPVNSPAVPKAPDGAERIPLAPQPAPSCLSSIQDRSNPGMCLEASSVPTLGRLYPLSTNLFVAVTGNVGIGTTSPAATLDVAGTARMTDTLTLAPGGDVALDVSAGNIYKEGALFIHTKGNFVNRNTAIGREALANVTFGVWNTATGYRALFSNTTGSANTATGYTALSFNATGRGNTASGSGALLFNTTGNENTASGFHALRFNMTGDDNTATGYRALYSSYGSHNTAFGAYALQSNTTGSFNIAVGSGAGSALTTGNNNIAIGNAGVAGYSGTIRIGERFAHTRTWIGGIRGVTTGAANAIPVLIDSTGQLGTVSSSRRFKEEIADMGDLTERLLELRPVAFRYKPEVQSGERPLEYGLIAEEVAEVFPDLVVYDEEGEPFTVKYHLLSSMLLNELKKLSERVEALEDDRISEITALRSRVAALEDQVASPAIPTAGR